MKNLSLLITVIISFAISAKGQIKNVHISPDSSITLDAVYAGFAAWNSFSTDSVHATKAATFRVGGAATWEIFKSLSANSFAIYESNISPSPLIIAGFYLKFSPSAKWKLQVGNMATLSTEQKPLPHSGSGQFESWTESKIPGTAPGAKLKYLPSKRFSIGVGAALRNGFTEYHGQIVYKRVTVSAYQGFKSTTAMSTDGIVRTVDEQYTGGAVTYDAPKKVYSTLAFRDKSVIGDLLVISLSHDLQLYSDVGYSLAKVPGDKLVRGEGGILKNFEGALLKGLVGVGYAYEIHAVKGYLFIHL